MRICYHTGQCGCNGCFGGNNINLCGFCAASAFKVSVYGTQRNCVCCRCLTHTDTRAAAAFQNSGTGRDDISQCAVCSQHIHYLFGAGRDNQTDIGMYGFAFQQGCHCHHICIRRVCAGADSNLIYFQTLNIIYVFDVIGRVRASYQRNDLIQCDGHFFVISCVCISTQFDPVFAAALSIQKCFCYFVRREYRCGCAQFCTHVCDGCTLGNRQCFYAFPGIFHNFAYAAFDRQSFQYFQDHVFCSYPRGEFPCQVDSANLRHCQIVSAAAHSYGNIQTACADGQHTDTAACGSMAVGAQQCFAGFAEAFQMYLMADAVTGFGEIDTVFGCYCLDIFVVVRIFKTCLQRIVVDVCYGFFCFDTGDPDGFKLQICHGTCRVLCQCLVDFDGDFFACCHFAAYQMAFDQFFSNIHSHFSFLPKNMFYLLCNI